MDTVLFNAMKRREEIRQELSDIDRFLRMYNRFKGGAEPRQPALFAEKSEPEHVEEQKESEAPQADGDVNFEPPSRGFTREMLKPHIAAVIEEAGRPLTRSQLLKALDERRTPVGGTNRSKNMGTILWRLRDDFVSLPGFGYWPRAKPYAPAEYDPEDVNSPAAIDHMLRQEQPADAEDE